ncbi:MAG: KpsF/GutQ family sugar-phosphate isomerase [Alphaproteobacteria bacterium]|nr:KpsF/GutQ family sugar-phosphate isomerase [Alphaproteobacteria bacterium]
MNILESARNIIQTEAEGLLELKDSLDHNFETAITTINAMKDKHQGRLIISGMGKSGHIATKLAATMASTGTPAFFVHPGEASHGDLGMITEHDVIILLSNSGENSEISDMIAYAKRFNIPLIGMTSNPDSALAQHSDILLLVPKAKEACSIGMAPTTSTTMMIALGDAVAITLLETSGMTREDFKIFHPGGKLGQKLKKVSDLMMKESDLPLVKTETTMDQVLLTMTEKNLGSAIIIDNNGALLGIITDGDLKRHMSPTLLTKTAGELMSPNPKTIAPDLLAAEGLDIMLNHFKSPITSLIVTDNKKVIGMLRIQECLQAGIA